MMRRILATLVCSLILAACQQPPAGPSALVGVAPAGQAAVKHEQDVPFSGKIVGHAQFVLANPRQCGPGYTTATDGQGTALHMGAITSHWEHCVQAGGGWMGEMVITAANGDEIHATYDGNRVAGPFPAVGEHLNLFGTMTITGGTGRFAHATGTADYTGWIVWEGWSDYDSPGEWQWDGRINY